VNVLAQQLKSAFENNQNLISSLDIPALDQEEA
jgi:hypothetical protein